MFGLQYGGYSHMGRFGSRGYNFLVTEWLMITFIIIGITVAVLFVVQLSRRSHDVHGNQEVMMLLKKRYARGEITHEEFESIKKTL